MDTNPRYTNEQFIHDVALPKYNVTLISFAASWLRMFRTLSDSDVGVWFDEDEVIQIMMFAIQDLAIRIYGIDTFANFLINQCHVKQSILLEYFDVPSL